MTGPTSRVPVAKTYKIYIDGKFPRTESGRFFASRLRPNQKLATFGAMQGLYDLITGPIISRNSQRDAIIVLSSNGLPCCRV